jgi:hypothetical protein
MQHHDPRLGPTAPTDEKAAPFVIANAFKFTCTDL